MGGTSRIAVKGGMSPALRRARRGFAQWRRTKRGREPIPGDLWSLAARAASELPALRGVMPNREGLWDQRKHTHDLCNRVLAGPGIQLSAQHQAENGPRQQLPRYSG